MSDDEKALSRVGIDKIRRDLEKRYARLKVKGNTLEEIDKILTEAQETARLEIMVLSQMRADAMIAELDRLAKRNAEHPDQQPRNATGRRIYPNREVARRLDLNETYVRDFTNARREALKAQGE